MKYLKFKNEEISDAMYEVPASFLFVLGYLMLIENPIVNKFNSGTLITSVLFSVLYYTIYKLFESKATVHMFPLVSFIESLLTRNIKIFVYRAASQVLGALFAILLFFLSLNIISERTMIFSVQPAEPFITGIFTGFLAQLIYFQYYFILRKWNISSTIRYLAYSTTLGLIYVIIAFYPNIIILNPFGLALHYLFSGNPVNVYLVLKGITSQIIIPMIFVSGTHLFVIMFIRYRKYLSDASDKQVIH
jgi:hypothetical protein